ncbi:MAG: flagellar filament capping protein FliD [Planctomycetota bacterium]
MGQIRSDIGLISGINSADIINQLIELESRPRIRVEQQNQTLQEQQQAFGGLSAQLLSLKLTAGRLTTPSTFTATTSTTSNEAVATVSSGAGATPGDFRFSVRRLVSAQQTVTSGFRDRETTPVAPDGGLLTFNRGESRLDRETRLEELNGGAGVQRGRIKITDLDRNSATVDLTDAITLQDVVTEINDAAIGVRAEIEGGGLVVRDITGQTTGGGDRSLIISDLGNTQTATQLGIAGDTDTGEIAGQPLFTIGDDTVLANLNDGLGIRTSGANDLQIIAADGQVFNINLANAVTLGDVADEIDDISEGALTLSYRADGRGLELIDNTGGGGTTTVASTAGSNAAEDLGLDATSATAAGNALTGSRLIGDLDSKLLKFTNGGNGLAALGGATYQPVALDTDLADLFQGAGLAFNGAGTADLTVTARNDADGTNAFSVDLDGATTVEELIDAFDAATGGQVTLELRDDRLFAFNNTATGDEPLVIRSANGSGVAEALGIAVNAETDVKAGLRLDPTGTADDGSVISVTTADGTATNIDLGTAETAGDLIALINDSGAGVRASLNDAGNGIKLIDETAGTGDLTIASVGDGALAEQLGIAGEFRQGVANGRDLEFAYVNEGASLDKLGIARGVFTIRDSNGRVATVDLTNGNENTLGDVISEINSRGLAINARVNDSGDGLVLEDLGGGTVDIEIEDDGSSTAADLGIAGTHSPGLPVDGSFKRYVRIRATDSLDDVTDRINDADLAVRASVISDGSVGRPFRLSLSGDRGGAGNAFSFSDNGLDFGSTEVATARDALVFVGSGNPETALAVTSGTNTLTNVIPGATITLNSTSDDPVTISVSDNPDALIEQVNAFAEGFNGIVDRIDELDSFDVETETRGLLLGDPTLQQVQSSIYAAVINPNSELSGRFKSLSEVGIRVGEGARLEVDEERLRAAVELDPDAVRDLFAFEQLGVDPETGEDDPDQIIAQGIAVEIDKLLERLTDAQFGVLQTTVDRIDQQILQNNNRIDQINDSIERQRANLERQFANLETALAELQDQSGALNQLAGLAGQAG